jgi:DNA polymerase-3 subunit gamma/tau
MFILATTEPHKIPATIQSRCQRFDFRRVRLEDQVARLQCICEQEKLQVEEMAIHELARMSDGGMRDALSLLDQVASFSDGLITLEQVHGITGGVAVEHFARLADAILATDVAAVLVQVETLLMQGKSPDRVLDGLAQFFREALMVKLMPAGGEPLARISHLNVLQAWAGKANEGQLFRWLDTLQKYSFELKQAVQPRPVLEIALMRCCVNEQPVTAVAAPSPAVQPMVADAPKPVAATPAPKPAAKPTAATSIAKTSMPVQPFVAEADSDLTTEVKGKWAQVLERMGQTAVSLRAWLINGQVVSATADGILVAFKNDIHRDTTEKDANKQKIEDVLAGVYGRPFRYVTIMLRDWEKVAEAQAPVKKEEPTLEMVALTEEGRTADGGYEQDWINEALNLFGEDLVKVEDDKI